MPTYLDFETSVAEFEGKIAELRALAAQDQTMSISDEVRQLEKKAEVARHPDRPHSEDYVQRLFTDFTALSGDRNFGDDHAIIGGPARFQGEPVMVLGQEKGFDTQSRIRHNFGMARPEGYRKAVRLMEMADRFQLPIITFIDTPGAYPGIGA